MTQSSVETLPLASIGQRILAYVLDALVVGIPGAFLVLAFADINITANKVSIPEWVSVVLAAVSAAYQTVMVHWRGQTLGKMALGITVVHATDGLRPSWWSAGLRALVPWLVSLLPLGALTLLLWFGVYLVAMFDPHRQGLHDKAAGTLVVRARTAPSPVPPPPPWPPAPGR